MTRSVRSTIKNKVTLYGITPLSRLQSEVTFLPNNQNGIRFIRKDLGSTIIIADHSNIDREDCFNYTSITNGIDKIKFAEHILCYLWCMKITDIDIEINTEEFPIFDGSCNYFNFCFKATDIKRFNAEVPKFFLKKELKVVNPYNQSYIIARPSSKFSISYDIQFKENTIENGTFTFDFSNMNFFDEIMNARTFIVTRVQKESLNKVHNHLPNSYIEFDEDKIISEEPLRYSNEATRHKILDVIGDFSLINHSLFMELECHRSGHYANTLMIKEIFSSEDNYYIE